MLKEEKVSKDHGADVKKTLSRDATLRRRWIQLAYEKNYTTIISRHLPPPKLHPTGPSRQERAAASLKSREEKVRSEQVATAKEMGKSRAGAGREEAERMFRQSASGSSERPRSDLERSITIPCLLILDFHIPSLSRHLIVNDSFREHIQRSSFQKVECAIPTV